MTILNDTRLQDYMKRVAEYGRQEGKGLAAKPDFAIDTVEIAHEGLIGADDAPKVWDAFAAASGKKAGNEKLGVQNDKTRKVRASETKVLIVAGTIAAFNAADVLKRAVPIINGFDNARGSTYQNLIKVARVQLEDRTKPLDDEQILEAITPSAKEERDELEHLKAVLKPMKKLHDGSEKDPTFVPRPSPELAAAILQIETRISVLTQMMEADALFAQAAKHGYSLVKPEAPAEAEANA